RTRLTLSARLSQAGVRCRKDRRIFVVRQPSEEMTNPPERLTQKQIGGGMIRRTSVSIAPCELHLAVETAKDTSRGKEIHRRVRDPLLDKLHVEDRLAICDQRAIHSEIEAPDQAAKLPRIAAELLALHRHVGDTNRRA